MLRLIIRERVKEGEKRNENPGAEKFPTRLGGNSGTKPSRLGPL